MKLLPAPYGWDSCGEVLHVQLERLGGPGPVDHKAVTLALLSHSCHPPALQKILGSLEHSLYQCWMRGSVVREIRRDQRLAREGIKYTVLAKYKNGERV